LPEKISSSNIPEKLKKAKSNGIADEWCDFYNQGWLKIQEYND